MDTSLWIEAAPFRQHVLQLVETSGLTWRVVAAHADVAPRAIRTLLHGRARSHQPVGRIHISVARALMRVDVDDLLQADHRETAAGETRTLFHTLERLGYHREQLLPWLTDTDIELLSNRNAVWCSAGTRARVLACHDWLTNPFCDQGSAASQHKNLTPP